MSDTFAIVQSMIAETCSVPVEKIKPESLLESLGVDSLDLIETLFDAEEKFNIRIPQDSGIDTSKSTVADIVKTIDDLIAAEKTAP